MTAPSRRELITGLGRGAGGALLFAIPIFMTMEMWQLGVTVGRHRLGLLLATTLVLAFGLERHIGLRSGRPTNFRETAADALIAVLVGSLTALAVLATVNVIHPVTGWSEAASIVAIEALPATIGASFARSQLGESAERGGQGFSGYRHQIFLMTAGAVVFAFGIAPTREIVVLAARMEPLHVVALIGIEIILMHAFVYGMGFKGGEDSSGGFWSILIRFTCAGFIIALALSAFLLWVFGRFDNTGAVQCLVQVIVLALPASLGAASARLIL